VVKGNLIGTDKNGSKAVPNGRNGVLIRQGASNNTVGERNVISGNNTAPVGTGVLIVGQDTKNNLVQGNFIGTDITGTKALPNVTGVDIFDAPNNLVSQANVISGNTENGIVIRGANATANVVQGNFVGTDLTGNGKLGNGEDGVLISKASNNIIGVGPTTGGVGNTIAFNEGNGVTVDTGTGNRISRNSIFANAGEGIKLVNNGNNSQPKPVLNSKVDNGNQTITLNLTANAKTPFTIEFFASLTDQPSCQGKTFLGSMTVTTDAAGHVTNVPVNFTAPAGMFLTATATDPKNNTSQFSKCVKVLPSQCIAPMVPPEAGLPLTVPPLSHQVPPPPPLNGATGPFTLQVVGHSSGILVSVSDGEFVIDAQLGTSDFQWFSYTVANACGVSNVGVVHVFLLFG
jgi:titin